MVVSSVEKQVATVQKSAAKKLAAVTETIGSPSAGDVIRQGDLYLVVLSGHVIGQRAKSNQLAPGTSQGSRHVAAGDCEVVEPKDKMALSLAIKALVPRADVPVELIGPVVVIRGRTEITHPEHGHKVIFEPCIVAVVYQRAFAEEVRRVRD